MPQQRTATVYGPGGFDPSKPANNTAGTAQVDVADEIVNADTLVQRATAALASNVTFLANGSPSNVEVVAQVRALTKQVNALIKLRVGQLADTTGT